eukprot:4646514-Pyramimonas_sp.AAC.1
MSKYVISSGQQLKRIKGASDVVSLQAHPRITCRWPLLLAMALEQSSGQLLAPACCQPLLRLRRLAQLLQDEGALLVAGHRCGRSPSAALLDLLQSPPVARLVVRGP